MITVALAEDQILVRDMLRDVINKFGGLRVVAEASNGLELIEQLKDAESPDVLLLDLAMPLMDGSKTAAWMKEHHPHTRILMLSSFDSELVMLHLLKAGVRGFITKFIHPAELETALRGVMTKNCFFLQEGAEKLMIFFGQAFHETGSLDDALLSDQEIELIKNCCSTDTYAQIGEKMHLSARTITDHVEEICRKLHVKNRIALAMHAHNAGLVYL